MKVNSHRLHDDHGAAVPFDPSPNVGGKITNGKPRFLVMHYTAGGTAGSAIGTFKKASDPRTSAHLVIDHDGRITQMVAFDDIAWHAGKSFWKGIDGLNKVSVGIEIVNWGILKGGPDQWLNWTGKPVPRDRVLVAEHKNSPGKAEGWEIFDEAQIDACVGAARAIVQAYGLSPTDVIGHDDIAPGRKTAPGPAFDLVRFRSHVFGRDVDVDVDPDVFAVRSPNGLNMRSSPDLAGAIIKNLPDQTQVRLIEKQGKWWMVAELVGGHDDITGWVHSNWLTQV